MQAVVVGEMAGVEVKRERDDRRAEAFDVCRTKDGVKHPSADDDDREPEGAVPIAARAHHPTGPRQTLSGTRRLTK